MASVLDVRQVKKELKLEVVAGSGFFLRKLGTTTRSDINF